MPEGVSTFVDENGNAHVSFPDVSLRPAAISRLLATGAPIEVDTSGKRRSYIVPEGNAREAGLLDVAEDDDEGSDDAPAGTSEPQAEPAKKAPAKKTPAKAPAKAPAKKAPAKSAAGQKRVAK